MSNKEIGLLVGAFAVVALLGAGAFAFTSTPAQPTIIQVPQETSAAATSPGQGGGITNATNLARECIIDLYGGVGHIPKMGVGKASVDDTIAQCVKARGGQIVTGGQCDASDTDGCSNTFADIGQDPDSDPMAIIFDVLDASGVVVDELYVTQGAQVLGKGGCPPEDPSCIQKYNCTKQAVDTCRAGKLVGCELAQQCIVPEIQKCFDRIVKVRKCPAGGGGGQCPAETDGCADSYPAKYACTDAGGSCDFATNTCTGCTGGGGGAEVTCKEPASCPSSDPMECLGGDVAVQVESVCATPQECKRLGGVGYGIPSYGYCSMMSECAVVGEDDCWVPSDAIDSEYICPASDPVCSVGGGGGSCIESGQVSTSTVSCEDAAQKCCNMGSEAPECAITPSVYEFTCP